MIIKLIINFKINNKYYNNKQTKYYYYNSVMFIINQIYHIYN